MSRRPDPIRIDEARRAAIRARLIGEGMTESTADAWIAAWASQAARDGQGSAAYWDAAWTWIEEERRRRAKP